MRWKLFKSAGCSGHCLFSYYPWITPPLWAGQTQLLLFYIYTQNSIKGFICLPPLGFRVVWSSVNTQTDLGDANSGFTRVEEVVSPLGTLVIGFTLSNLILVVRKSEVNASRVDIQPTPEHRAGSSTENSITKQWSFSCSQAANVVRPHKQEKNRIITKWETCKGYI